MAAAVAGSHGGRHDMYSVMALMPVAQRAPRGIAERSFIGVCTVKGSGW